MARPEPQILDRSCTLLQVEGPIIVNEIAVSFWLRDSPGKPSYFKCRLGHALHLIMKVIPVGLATETTPRFYLSTMGSTTSVALLSEPLIAEAVCLNDVLLVALQSLAGLLAAASFRQDLQRRQAKHHQANKCSNRGPADLCNLFFVFAFAHAARRRRVERRWLPH